MFNSPPHCNLRANIQFFVNSIHSLNIKQNAFKSLDAYHTVCAEGWPRGPIPAKTLYGISKSWISEKDFGFLRFYFKEVLFTFVVYRLR